MRIVVAKMTLDDPTGRDVIGQSRKWFLFDTITRCLPIRRNHPRWSWWCKMEESEQNSFNDEDRMESVAVEGQQVDFDMMSNEENQTITVDQVTGGRRVLGQNVCSFLAHLKIFQASRKLWIRTRILCTFWIWAWEFFVSFCSRVVRESLKSLKNLFGREIFTRFFTF